MSVYEVTYLEDDSWAGECLTGTYFEGTWLQLQDFIKGLKDCGCWAIEASCVSDD